MRPSRTPEEIRTFTEMIGHRGPVASPPDAADVLRQDPAGVRVGGMGYIARVGRWSARAASKGWGSEVELGEEGPGEQEGHVRESFTFYANRFSRRHFERNVTEVAEQLGVQFTLDVKAGLLFCDIHVAAEGEQEQVDRFRRYAVGLSAASDGGVGGGP